VTVVAEVSVDARAVLPGDLLEEHGSLRVELFELIPLDEGPVPYFWLHSESDAFEGALRDDDRVNRVRVLDRFGDAALYRVDWSGDVDFGLLDCLDDAVLESATGSADGWTLRLRFVDHEALSAFRDRCGAAGFPVDVARIFHPGPPEDGTKAGLTEPQREALELARDRGYFDDPRGTTLAISRQAVSYRIRRGVRHLVDSMLLRP
jgi:predicted DNA binding protein